MDDSESFVREMSSLGRRHSVVVTPHFDAEFRTSDTHTRYGHTPPIIARVDRCGVPNLLT